MSLQFFPRGPGPLVSVLLSTRGRPEPLCRAIDSLHSLAKDPSRLEFILKADDDDAPTLAAIEKLEKLLPLKKIVSPRGNGYHSIHLWLDQKMRMAAGDWLLAFNDDATMASQDWDEVILNAGTTSPWPAVEDVCLLLAQTAGRPFAQEFFFLRRRTFEILGGTLSQSPHADNWIHGVMKSIGAVLELGLEVRHYSDTIGDRTREESVEAYKTTIDSLTSVAGRREQLRQANLLLDYIEFFQKSRAWAKDPPGLGWCWWRGGPGAKAQHVYYKDGVALVLDKGGQVDPALCWLAKDRGGEWLHK